MRIDYATDYVRRHIKKHSFFCKYSNQIDHLAEQLKPLLFSMAVYRTIGGNVSVRLNYDEC